MKIKGSIKVVKNVPGGMWVSINTDGITGLFKGFVPIEKPEQFEVESPFEIELKEKPEPEKAIEEPEPEDE